LYYNPYAAGKTISLKIGHNKKVDLYNTVSGKFVARNVSTTARIKILPKAAAVIVIVPTGGTITYKHNKMMVNGVVIDYMCKRKM
jgi:hypothetical protein